MAESLDDDHPGRRRAGSWSGHRSTGGSLRSGSGHHDPERAPSTTVHPDPRCRDACRPHTARNLVATRDLADADALLRRSEDAAGHQPALGKHTAVLETWP
jgi:hypothetical protein